MGDKLDALKFAISGGIVSGVFVLISEFALWVTLVPVYIQMMQNLYGVYYASGIVKSFAIALLIGIVLGFVLSWIFAKVYNKLGMIRVK